MKPIIPWEESEVYQEFTYRLLRWAVLILTVGSAVVCLFTGDWSYFGYWMIGLAILFLAVLAYAGIIWLVGRLAILAVRVFRRLFHREH